MGGVNFKRAKWEEVLDAVPHSFYSYTGWSKTVKLTNLISIYQVSQAKENDSAGHFEQQIQPTSHHNLIIHPNLYPFLSSGFK